MGMYCNVLVASQEELGQFSTDSSLFDPSAQRGTATVHGVSIEKAWHGLHYLLTGAVWTGHGPLAFLLAGGQQMGDDEESPVRWFTPDETIQIHEALSKCTDDDLWSRFDAEEMEHQDVYPGIWDEPEDELKEEYLAYFRELKQVIATAAQNGQGLVVSIG